MTTSETPELPKKAEPPPVLYRKGEFYVTWIRLNDKDMADGGIRRAFALVHAPTGVIVSTGGLLAGMIQAAYALDEQLKEARNAPDEVWKEMQGGNGRLLGPNFQF